MAETLGSRSQNHKTTLMEKSILLFVGKNACMDLDLGFNRLWNRIVAHHLGVVDEMKFRKLLLQDIILCLDLDLCLKNGTRMAPCILTNRNQCLVIVADFGRNLINARPPDLLHRTPPICKKVFRLMRLDPNLVEMHGQGLPVLVRPFRIGNPNVATCLRKERWIQNLKKDIDFGFVALGIRLGNLAKLDIVFPENVGDNSHQKSSILHQSRATIDNQVDSHYITSGCVL